MYINSARAAYVSAGLAIYDTMQYIRCPRFSTLCIGQAASMRLRCCSAPANKGERFCASEFARDFGASAQRRGYYGQAADIARHAQRNRQAEVAD